MEILRQYKGEDTWEKVSLDDALEKLEGAYKPTTIMPMLEEGAILQTPFSFYKKAKEES